MTSRKLLAILFLSLCVSASLPLNTPAQIRPVYDQGALGLTQLLKRLNTTASALMIGAHPDDEDTALLAYLARGENARTAYLSLTRGDGGQNIIGPELGEALGVIRTEELLQARKLDGADQFFTRAYDYGFSKTLAEAKEKWDEKVILCDVVRVIRTFRPLVVISQFSGTAADGHGQHQYAGYISPIAVKAAADPTECKEAGVAWQVKKFYVRHRGTGEPTLRINTGKYDPLLGRSYFEIAMHARSQHRTQEQGVLELKGDQFSQLNLVTPTGALPGIEKRVFDGLDLGSDLLGGIDGEFIDDAYTKPDALRANLIKRLPESESNPMYPIVVRAILQAAGVRIDVLADRETTVAGETFPVAVRMFSPHANELKVIKVEFDFPSTPVPEPTASVQPTFFRREVGDYSGQFSLTVPATAIPTQPFWLLAPRQRDLFTIASGYTAGQPVQESAVAGTITLEIRDKRISIRRPVEYRYADDIRGEIRRELNIVPKITIEPNKNLTIVSTRTKLMSREISLALTNNASGPASGKIRLLLPGGWTSSPAEADFAMTRKGESSTVRFNVNIPGKATAGSFEIRAEAVAGGETFRETMQTIAYEHIQTHRIYRPAKVDVKLIDLQTSPVKVGYVRGSGDRVSDAIRELGMSVEEIDEESLTSGDLSRFDTIVVGIRAYQVRPDVVANNQRLLDFVTKGGTLIVQYQLPATYAQQNLTPFPTQMGPRVADENALVTIAEPTHPIFNFPNKITQEDFKGWVQERNLYNFVMTDPRYVGLLESHDAGEPENKGGLVVADIGKGKYVYCSYSLFRQLPAGVPGAYRLLANMLSLPKAGSASAVK